MFPKIGEFFKRTMEQVNFGNIKTPEFQRIKEQLIVLQFVLDNCDNLQESQREHLISLIMSDGTRGYYAFHKAKDFLDSTIPKEDKARSSSGWWGMTWLFKTADQVSSPAQRMMQQALELAKQNSDADFLSGAEQLSSLGDLAHAAVVKAIKLAQTYFDETIAKTLKKIADNAFHIQRDQLLKHVQLDASHREQKDAAAIRQDFLRTIEQKSLPQAQR